MRPPAPAVVDGLLRHRLTAATRTRDLCKRITLHDGTSLLGTASRDHLLIEWWHRNPGGNPHTWSSYKSTTEQYTEYYALHTDGTGQETGTGEVLFREYYDLVNDPYQLTNLLYGATPADERRLGIPALAARLAADRAA